MKHVLLTLLIIVTGLVTGCKKDEPTLNPDLTIGLTGVYPLTSYQEGAQVLTLPTNGYSGKFTTTRIDDTHLSARLTITDNGKSSDYSTNTFALARDGSNASLFNITVQGQAAGTMTATLMNVSARSADGTLTIIKAAR